MVLEVHILRVCMRVGTEFRGTWIWLAEDENSLEAVHRLNLVFVQVIDAGA